MKPRMTPSGPAIPEKPILFSGAMVRSILSGQKTQTRRVITPQPKPWEPNVAFAVWRGDEPVTLAAILQESPFQVGTRLWVKETWQYADWTEDGYPFIRYQADNAERLCERITDPWGEKLSDVWAELSDPKNYAIDNKAADRKWRPSIFMPRWASRITLEITDVRVQRVQETSEADARAEGVTIGEPVPGTVNGKPATVVIFEPRQAYAALWDAINGRRPGCSWADNPFVYAISFKVSGPAILSQGDGR
jgi:hypothetical protein